MSNRETTMQGYPPEKHFMRDLRIVFENGSGARRMLIPLAAPLLNDAGSLDLGVAATLLDIQGGGDAISAVQPDWAVTSDMTLHLLRPVSSGVVVGRSQVLRAGRNTVVLQGELLIEGDERPVVQSQLGFTRIVRREDTPSFGAESPARVDFGADGSSFKESFFAELGLCEIDAERGALELAVTDYHRNSLGALQGGLVVAIASQAAEVIGRSHSGLPLVTTDLSAHYMAMGKVGPIRSEARVLRADADAVVSRIELRDCGANDRLCTVVTATARVFGVEASS